MNKKSSHFQTPTLKPQSIAHKFLCQNMLLRFCKTKNLGPKTEECMQTAIL